jgi:hypothetical protein
MPEQLDIFAHSRDVMLRNDLLQALQLRDAAAARSAFHALAVEFPDDPSRAACERLVQHLGSAASTPLTRHDALATLRAEAAGELHPAACQAFGVAAGTAWMAPVWSTLARRSAALPFSAASSEDHAAPLWLRAREGSACIDAVHTIESWRRKPVPLGWVLQAHWLLGDDDACWPLLAELAWLAPRRLATLMPNASTLAKRLLQDFDSRFEGSGTPDDLAWFPAWLLCEAPALAPHLAQAQRCAQDPAERAMRLLVELLGLERQGRQADIVRHRRAVRDLSAPLFAAYIARR